MSRKKRKLSKRQIEELHKTYGKNSRVYNLLMYGLNIGKESIEKTKFSRSAK